MKLKIKYLSFILSLFSCFLVQAQTNSKQDLSNFKIIIKNTDDGISMKSLNGSAWLDLSFNLKNYVPQAIDEYGMTELGKVSDRKDTKLSNFLFTITKTQEGVNLKGIEGTAWTDLSFTLQQGNKQAIDQFGMTSLN